MNAASLLLSARRQLAGAPRLDAAALGRQRERQGLLEAYLGELRGVLDDLGASAEYFEQKAALHLPRATAPHSAEAALSPLEHETELPVEWPEVAVASEEPLPVQRRPRR